MNRLLLQNHSAFFLSFVADYKNDFRNRFSIFPFLSSLVRFKSKIWMLLAVALVSSLWSGVDDAKFLDLVKECKGAKEIADRVG